MINSPMIEHVSRSTRIWKQFSVRFAKFASVGIANTLIDIGVLNLLLWLFPTISQTTLLQYNIFAVLCGACNSFFWNKYWTFRHSKNHFYLKEILDFMMITFFTLVLNTCFLFLLSTAFPGIAMTLSWKAMLLKCISIGGTFSLSFLGMQYIVFRDRHKQEVLLTNSVEIPGSPYAVGLSVILPAYNEEANIHTTLYTALFALPHLVEDFEIIVVNDGSKDGTGAIAEAIACTVPGRVKVLHHVTNKGYGAALSTGFLAATKEFSFYMDSDGQFDIRDLARLLPELESYDGVFGYRIDRQDPFLRKLNAWGWNMLIRFFFRLHIRDIDGAFKIFRTAYFHDVSLEARGALLVTELVYKFSRAGYTYTEVGVLHYPRQQGESTGASLPVILRAFKELFYYANKWSTEEA